MLRFTKLRPLWTNQTNRLVQASTTTNASNRNQQRHISSAELQQLPAKIFETLSSSTPVYYTQNALYAFHETTGLPWYMTILASTFLVRLCLTFPLALYQHRIISKLQGISQEMPAIADELKKETARAIKLFGWSETKAKVMFRRSMKKQWDKLVIRENCHPLKTTIVFWTQIPIWVCYSTSLRNFTYMLPSQDLQAQLIFTELSHGGFGWIPNLTVPDSSWILPVILGVVNLSIVEMQTLTRLTDETRFQKVLKNIFRVFSVVMVPIATTVPSCVCLYWTTSSVFGLIQNVITLSPRVKRTFGIKIFDKQLQNPYRLMYDRVKKRRLT